MDIYGKTNMMDIKLKTYKKVKQNLIIMKAEMYKRKALNYRDDYYQSNSKFKNKIKSVNVNR